MKSRIESVEVMRVLAAIAVITIHQKAFFDAPGTIFSVLAVGLNQLARFAVPFFFVVAGYFWGRRLRAGEDVWRVSVQVILRLIGMFLFWSLVYLLPFGLTEVDWADWQSLYGGIVERIEVQRARSPLELIFHGTWLHLWFLPALSSCVFIAAIFVGLRRLEMLWTLATVLYVVGVLGRAYATTPIGLHLPFDTLFGPFFGLALFTSGYALSARSAPWSWRSATMLMMAGAGLHFAEIFGLWRNFGVTPVAHSYVFGTLPFGLGAAMLALSSPRFLSLPGLGKIGSYTAGVYCVHLIVLDRVDSAVPSRVPWQELPILLLVFAASVLIVWIFRRTPVLSRMV